jgi:hypothetical protein
MLCQLLRVPSAGKSLKDDAIGAYVNAQIPNAATEVSH